MFVLEGRIKLLFPLSAATDIPRPRDQAVLPQGAHKRPASIAGRRVACSHSSCSVLAAPALSRSLGGAGIRKEVFAMPAPRTSPTTAAREFYWRAPTTTEVSQNNNDVSPADPLIIRPRCGIAEGKA